MYNVDEYQRLFYMNINQLIQVKFCLVDSNNLVSIFPNCEKVFVKMCEAWTGEISAI